MAPESDSPRGSPPPDASATSQLDAERALRESEQRYRELVELSPDPILVQVDRRFAYANPAALKAFRVAKLADMVGRPITDFIHPELSEMVDARISQLEEGRATPFVEQRFVRTDGTIGDAEVASLPMVFEGKRAILTVARDVSERKQAERLLVASERRVRAQFKAIPVPTYAWQRVDRESDEFVLVDYNDAGLAITGGSIAGSVGKTLGDLYGPDHVISAEVRRCLRDRATIHREMDDAPRGTSETKRLSVTYVAVPPDLVLVYTEDISERLKLEEQLRHSQKMEAIGQLAGGVAHDFNNLLTVIQSFADGLADDFDEGDPRHADVQEIRRATRRAAALTSQLLAFSRKQVLLPRTMNLNAVLVGLEPMLRRLIGEDVAIEIVPAPGLPPVHADPGQIEQVIVNLAVNARDAMPHGGTLTLRTGAAEGDFLSLSVRDTGHGMDDATRLRIFDPFFTTKEQGRGTGLGLATVYGIVQQSGGSIRVVSQPGEGSTFEVLLPRAAGQDIRAASEAPASRIRSGGERVLLVEDEKAVRAVTRHMLEGAGYIVVEARDGREALTLAAGIDGVIDLLLTDVVMPGISGPKLHEQLVAQRPGLPVLYVSGYTDDEMFRRGVLSPGAEFLQKPFVRGTLLGKVRAAIERAMPEGVSSK